MINDVLAPLFTATEANNFGVVKFHQNTFRTINSPTPAR